ncbi:MAG: uroporphyrinogen-III synthase [Bacteroidia bacterium]|nr:uroporphyrinogen-III synthase [Bacteroidia bacterium]
MHKKEIKTVLISQPKPTDENSPYFKLAEKYKLELDFRKFIQIEGVSLNEFRKQNVNPLDFTAVIFTSRFAIDHYFRILKDLKVELPAEMKYFCVAEGTAKYLQKYITIRKRKLFVGERSISDLIVLMKKHMKDKYIFPCSSVHTPQLTDWMDENSINYSKAIIYNTVPSDLSDLEDKKYDLICFYSPAGVEALVKNFPEWKNHDTAVAAFGPTTTKAAQEAGLTVEIEAPKPNMPSMTAAIEHYLKNISKGA